MTSCITTLGDVNICHNQEQRSATCRIIGRTSLAEQDTAVIQGLAMLSSSIRSINVRMPSSEVSRYWPEVEDLPFSNRNALVGCKGYPTGPKVNLESTRLGPIWSDRIVNEWIAIKPAINTQNRQSILRNFRVSASYQRMRRGFWDESRKLELLFEQNDLIGIFATWNGMKRQTQR
jgi:hypothetical protein